MADRKDPKIDRGGGSPRRGEDDNGKGGPSPSGKGPGGKGPHMVSRGAMGWLMLGALAVLLVILMMNSQNQAKEVPITRFITLAEQGVLLNDADKPVVVKDSEIFAYVDPEKKGDLEAERIKAGVSPYHQAYWVAKLEAAAPDLPVEVDHGRSIFVEIMVTWMPLILIGLLIWFIFFRSIRAAGGGPGGFLGSFGRSRHKVLTKEHSDVTLDDVAGIDEAKDEVQEIIEFLKNPKKFQRLGGRVPRGVLLIGRPGCGKTLLAKAVAGEADVPFFSISGSDFVEMFVGVGASRVRDLFKQAKDSAPCIIFLDEIDAVGRRRGAGFSSGGHDEREQTLNAILVEMDGFDSSDQVIVVASTNRADVLDPALTRPGRFDRQVNVPLPDLKGRLEILKVHSRKVKLSPSINMEKLARGTPMFSGAELAAIINEAAISATLANKDFVEQDDLEEARDKVKYGRALKSRTIEEDEKKVIAYHEAGHAIVMYFDEHSDPLHKVTIIPRGDALGVTFMLPEKDRHIIGRKNLMGQLRVTFGGRIAEEMFCDDISSGAAMDIRQATSIARAMVTEYGMSEKVGFRFLGEDERRQPWESGDHLSEETEQLIDQEVNAIIVEAQTGARQMLEEHREQLDALAQALLKYESLTREEVDKIMAGQKLDKATVSELLQAERAKADEPTVAPRAGHVAPPEDSAPGAAMPSPA